MFDIVKEKTIAGLMNAGMMNALLSMYKKPFAVNKVYLMRHPIHLKIDKYASVSKHINE